MVVAASNAAAVMQSDQTEAEHFLVALLVGPPSTARDYLSQHGMTREDVELAIADTQESDVSFDDHDIDALATLGFDLPQTLQQLEERFGSVPPVPAKRRGPRRLRVGFGDSAKRLLSQALVEASFRDQEITPAHLLLGLLRDPSPISSDLMAPYSITYEDACEHLLQPPQSNAG